MHVHKIVKTFSKESAIALMMAHTFSYVPDDYNRVVLDSIPREPDSDYVNASYVDVSNIFCFMLWPHITIFISCCRAYWNPTHILLHKDQRKRQ